VPHTPEAPITPEGYPLLFSGRDSAGGIGLPALNVDTTKTITHLGLCAGYGGIELGLKRVLPALRTVALCEIEAFACANLVAKMEAGLMDPAPIWTDLKTFPWAEFRDRVDVLTGGYPCQPFSAAGKRLGAEDPRHLWPYIADGIRLLRPRVCFFENVEGHISLGLREVVGELEELGYAAAWGIFSASEVGAPHQRKRVFILAHRNNQRLEGHWGHVAKHDSQGRQRTNGHAWPSRPSHPQHAWEPPRVVGNAAEQGFPFGGGQSRPLGKSRPQSEPERSDESLGNAEVRDSRRNALQLRQGKKQYRGTSGSECNGRRQTESTLGGDTDGPACGLDYAELYTTCDNRTDELRLLGNGVVPATAAKAFTTLWNQLNPPHLLTTPSR